MNDITWGRALKIAVQEYGTEESDAMLLLEYAAQTDRNRIYRLLWDKIPAEVMERFCEVLNRRKTHLPVQYITGQTNFMGLEFMVTPDVLIPRPETELLTEMVIKASKGKSVLDLCTGSGCIAVSLAVLGNCKQVSAADISEKALSVARYNAKAHQSGIHWYCGDLFAPLGAERFDIIVSNPPYIPTGEITGLMSEVRDYEPHLALDGSGDGLEFYRRIAREAGDHLTPDGELFLEIGCEQGKEVEKLLSGAGFSSITIHRDYSGLDRMVHAKYMMGDSNV